MRKYFSVLFFLFLFSALHAQYKVRFILKEQTAIHHESIYITGTFSNWDSTANPNYLLKPYHENEKSIVLTLNPGAIRYKFHRGSWLTVEKQYGGNEVPDRTITISKDTTLLDSVASWRDELIADKKYALVQEKSDTNKISILAAIAQNYAFFPEFYNADSALYYAQKAIDLVQNIKASNKYKSWVQSGYSSNFIFLQEVIATLLHSLGNYPKALEIRLENLNLAEKEKDKFLLVYTLRNITDDYTSMKDYEKVLEYGKKMSSIVNTLDTSNSEYPFARWRTDYIISNAYYNLHDFNSALYYAKEMNSLNMSAPWYLVQSNLLLADIYSEKGNNALAFSLYREAISNSLSFQTYLWVAMAHEGMATLFKKENKIDSALYYARLSLAYFRNNKTDVQAWGENTDIYIAELSPLIADLYKDNHQLDSAYKYLSLSVQLKDSLFNVDKVRQFQTLTFNEINRRQQLEQQSKEERQQYENKVRVYLLIAAIIAIVVVALILYRNNKQKQKANVVLQQQKAKVEQTLNELKSTQAQLIQSEKMASLGELTAGIAHEIQNPLNFVNNFSEVNKEMIEELLSEKSKVRSERNEELENEILNDIKTNEEKINHHGKRADAIVKGMLQHSRKSSGQKEPTDINALCDEYLRLSYHGLRAKDKSFNAEFKTEFDESIGKINIVPQDIGRVLLNLFNNAFYAVKPPNPLKGEHYKPLVSVSTRKITPLQGMGAKLEIKVNDNGNGIPQNIVDKIFQPFFTTKPTGQGTGLGLSLAYDIITKEHNGTIRAESKEGEGSVFIIQLPV